ncbi:MAG: cysteine desulfurase [Bdellovibrionaceae bacterium]|jgi:cysteine desulfurase|nr:cysteine desulfurase [Pseudobdellovibrionaceae bacterium]
MQTIYMDYAATTPCHPEIKEIFLRALEDYANPSSEHALGWTARRWIEQAEEQVRAALHGPVESEIYWTSGATESNHAIFHDLKERLLAKQWPFKPHVLISAGEHPSVSAPARALAERGLIDLEGLLPDEKGQLSVDTLRTRLRPETVLVSIMAVQNELGTIFPVTEIAQELKDRAILFHVDATQAMGKIAFDLSQSPIDALSLSGHKIYAPKGVGLLYYNPRKWGSLHPWMLGGGQQKGRRAGTLVTPGIAALGAALSRVSHPPYITDQCRTIEAWREEILRGLDDIYGNSLILWQRPKVPHVPHIIPLGLTDMKLPSFLLNIAFSRSSACSSAKSQGKLSAWTEELIARHARSRDGLQASTRSSSLAQAMIHGNTLSEPFFRLSLGEGLTLRDISRFLEVMKDFYSSGRVRSPERTSLTESNR